jgi:predicted nucleotidyltransferase
VAGDASSVLDLSDIVDRVASVARENPAVERVHLFGSYARGEADAASDVDLRVKLDRSLPFGMFDLGALYGSFVRALGREVDVVTSDNLGSDDFARAVERDEVLLYERPA